MSQLRLLAAVAMFFAAPAFAEEDTLTIGMTLSQTGPLNIDSVAQQRGAELWRDQVSEAGGLKVGDKRYKVRYVTYDDQSQGGRVQQLYTRLIVQDKAQFLFSPYSSGLCATAAVITEQYGRLMLITGGAEPKTYTLGNKYLVQVITSADHYLSGAIGALESKSPHAKVAFVYSDDPASKAITVAAREQAKESGFSIVLDESYAPATTDFSPIINKIVTSSADALLGGGHYTDSATLARQIYDQKANLKYVSLLVAPDSPEFASLGEAAFGITVPSQWEIQSTHKPEFGPTGAEFVKAFQDKFKIAPDYHAASGYQGRHHSAACHRAGRLGRCRQGGGGAQRHGRHHLLRSLQDRDRCRAPWAADRPRNGVGAMAKEKRPAGAGGRVAEVGADRRYPVSAALSLRSLSASRR
jgi:branched-chain amino acid transport system substrate-binding protein